MKLIAKSVLFLASLVVATGVAKDDIQSSHVPAYSGASGATLEQQNKRRVLVEYFYSPACRECRELDSSFLSDFTNDFAPYIDFRKADISLPAACRRLMMLQENLGVRLNEPVSIYIDESIPILGREAIESNLGRIVMERVWMDELSPTKLIEERSAYGLSDVMGIKLDAFSIPVVLLAGLADGINPCAFATVVFFVTVLLVSGMGRRGVVIAGFGFSLAVFATYLLIGFGAFRVLQLARFWPLMSELLRWLMIALLAVLALLSFYDAWVFQKYQNASVVILQLPDRLKDRIHSIIRERLGSGSLFLSALGIGIIVTLIESVCTGQVYFPTLVMLSRHAETRSRAFSLLLLYNLMFIVPLLGVMLAAYLGARGRRLVEWGKNEVVGGKILMGLLFLGLAVAFFIF